MTLFVGAYDKITVAMRNAITIGCEDFSPTGGNLNLLCGLLSKDSLCIITNDGCDVEHAIRNVLRSNRSSVDKRVGLCKLLDGNRPLLTHCANELDALVISRDVVAVLQIVVELSSSCYLFRLHRVVLLPVFLHHAFPFRPLGLDNFTNCPFSLSFLCEGNPLAYYYYIIFYVKFQSEHLLKNSSICCKI